MKINAGDVLIKDKETDRIYGKGTFKIGEVETLKSEVFVFKKDSEEFNNLLPYVGETVTIQESNSDGVVIVEGEFKVTQEGEKILLTEIAE